MTVNEKNKHNNRRIVHSKGKTTLLFAKGKLHKVDPLKGNNTSSIKIGKHDITCL